MDFTLGDLGFDNGFDVSELDFSRNIEQFRIECDDRLYRYIEDFSDRVFAAYSTINHGNPRPKPVRGNRLWGAITD